MPNSNVTDKDKAASAKDDAAIIAECVDRMQISIAADGKNREQALDDLTFLSGDQWDPVIKAQRQADARPCLTVNKLPVTLHQVTNSQRQNVPSIHVHPASERTTAKVAEIVEGGIRAVEYRSRASTAYDTAVNSAAAIGVGYFRLVTQYVKEDSFDQELAFRRIRNSFTVYMDPNIVEVDGSDQQWCILSAKEPRTNFKVSYPDADPVDFSAVRGLGDKYADWASETDVRLAEYYRIFRKPATAVLLSNGESGFEEDLLEIPQGVTVVKTRKTYRPTVQWFKLTATQVVERAEIPCKWIPVFPVLGDEIDIDGKVSRRGIIRNAKDPARMYNYWMTAATEEIGLRQRAPFIGAEGQFDGHEKKWRNANTVSYPYLEYKPKSLGGQMVPAPVRQQMSDVPVGVLAMAQHASEDIKATTGYFDASLGAQGNETSGVAIRTRDRQGEVSSFHYTDNLHTVLVHAGRCMVDMWPKVYDGTRTIPVVGKDNKIKYSNINTPVIKRGEDGAAKQEITNSMANLDLEVVVSAGPSYDTLRQEAVDGMIETAKQWPKLMDIAGDKVIRSMDWPFAEQIADRVEKTIPPELTIGEDGDTPEDHIATPQGPVHVKKIPALIAQMQQQMQQMQQQLQEAAAGIDKAKISAQASVETANIAAMSAEEVAEIRGWIELLKLKMEPPPALTKDVVSGLNSSQPAQ